MVSRRRIQTLSFSEPRFEVGKHAHLFECHKSIEGWWQDGIELVQEAGKGCEAEEEAMDRGVEGGGDDVTAGDDIEGSSTL